MGIKFWRLDAIHSPLLKSLIIGFLVLCVLLFALALYWGDEPELFDVRDVTREYLHTVDGNAVTGATSTATLIHVVETLLDKPGGYQRNDVMPPTVIMDNIPSWEFGALVQVRDFAAALRNDMSRSQTQSTEDTDLAEAEPQFNIDASSWLVPRAEGEYRQGAEALQRYLDRLAVSEEVQAQFFARADNLEDWLAIVEKRLGSLSQRLSASVGQERINTDLGGDAEAQQSTATARQMRVKTDWIDIDDVFYEARGASWALTHFLRAVEVDFASVLEKKNARVSLQQIIRELEATQDTVWSPMILNGSGFGLVVNHSLVMASYVSRANAAVIDLRNLLNRG